MKVLLMGGDKALGDPLSSALGRQGFLVDCAGDSDEAGFLLERNEYSAVVFLWRSPGVGGLSPVASLRRDGIQVPGLVIGNESEKDGRIAALDAGADAFLAAPVSAGDVGATLRALARRGAVLASRTIEVGRLVIDLDASEIFVQGRRLDLTPKEYLILEALARRPGRNLAKSYLLGQAWPDNDEPDSRALEVHVCHLRRKLPSPSAGVFIVTRVGFGYALLVDPSPKRPISGIRKRDLEP